MTGTRSLSRRRGASTRGRAGVCDVLYLGNQAPGWQPLWHAHLRARAYLGDGSKSEDLAIVRDDEAERAQGCAGARP